MVILRHVGQPRQQGVARGGRQQLGRQDAFGAVAFELNRGRERARFRNNEETVQNFVST